jgi:hypothetical protein
MPSRSALALGTFLTLEKEASQTLARGFLVNSRIASTYSSRRFLGFELVHGSEPAV